MQGAFVNQAVHMDMYNGNNMQPNQYIDSNQYIDTNQYIDSNQVMQVLKHIQKLNASL